MKKEYIATPRRTKEILQAYNFSFKKSLGQNFIIDLNILRNMIEHAKIDRTCNVIEIGPGIGSLTEQLAQYANKVVAFEIDERLLDVLRVTLQAYQNVTVVHEDFLRIHIDEAIATHFDTGEKNHVVANLPYYVTTPILMKILEEGRSIDHVTVMLQKEVAERIVAKPNNKAYGSLSIVVQYYAEAEIVMDVPKTVFIPQPNVTSSVLHLTRRKEPAVCVKNEPLFFEIVQASFAHRRKTLRNNLTRHFKNLYSNEQVDALLHHANIDGKRRGESLTIAEFAQLTNSLSTQINES
ncbi:MAG TPA: 16S rRNA (adenine(1518)-N(6)/adenine(1519)-N(6))-dimethyltransferase RsmA [Pseudogracilibacillus sp.]|nr:16S rRNA (adenine(1518)-N(6)/adenine(1519)-N(6))-dimethyltransferase RsmA [Pseudogracilibacillus sp.]